MPLYYVGGEFGCSGCANGCSECDPVPEQIDDTEEAHQAVMASLRKGWEREAWIRGERPTVEIPVETNAEVVDGGLR